MSCQTQVETLEAVDGLELYCEVHSPAQTRGVIIAIHDYAEHCGLYRGFFQRLCQDGYKVYAYDWRGHGKSPGERGLIKRFDDCLEDLDLLLARVKDREAQLPLFILGQGIGALIGASFAVSRRPHVNGLVLLSVVLDLPLKGIAKLGTILLGGLMPKTAAHHRLRETLLQPYISGTFKDDALAFKGEISNQTIREILSAGKQLRSFSGQVPLDILVIFGADSALGRVQAQESWLDRIAASDKTVLRYDNSDRQLLLQRDRDQVAGEIIEWCEHHRQFPHEEEIDDDLDNDAL
jgi:lysophospholipase